MYLDIYIYIIQYRSKNPIDRPSVDSIIECLARDQHINPQSPIQMTRNNQPVDEANTHNNHSDNNNNNNNNSPIHNSNQEHQQQQQHEAKETAEEGEGEEECTT